MVWWFDSSFGVLKLVVGCLAACLSSCLRRVCLMGRTNPPAETPAGELAQARRRALLGSG
jgi:hypothetical protein